MDIALRILHILFGIFWAGATFYGTLIQMPRLRALGPVIERPVMRSLLRINGPVMVSSGLIVLGTGIAMALRIQGNLNAYFTTGWGLAMLIAFIAIILILVITFGFIGPSALRIMRLSEIDGHKLSNNEDQQLERAMTRFTLYERINFILILIAVLTMPVSRFV